MELTHEFTPRGAALTAFKSKAREVILAGAAGTGKSRALLEKLHMMALLNPGMDGLIVRQVARSLTASALKTWERDVVPEALRDGSVRFYGGSARKPPAYLYTNGSSISLGGMDDPIKVMSTERDVVYVQEATELDLEGWQALLSRLRNGKVSFQQLLADCNPGHPQHWLKERGDSGKALLLESLHEDNPRYFAADGRITQAGADYMGILDSLTGVQYLRLRKGIWAAAEGVIYSGFSTTMHVIEPFPIPDDWEWIWAIDFGFTNPFCWQAWALDPDGRAYLVREVYMTGRLVEDHARQIMALGMPTPSAVVCDHDAEDRATWERHTGLGTVAAEKAVTVGIDAVQARLRPADDGRPRMQFFADALVEKDETLVARKLPTCTIQEIPGYIWAPEPPSADRKHEQPVKKNDHGCDTKRYMTMEADTHGTTNVRWG